MAASASAQTPVPNPTHHAAKTVPTVHVLIYQVAPADEYFGRLKMSILGIRNTIKDDGLKVDSDATQAPGVLNSVALTEDALHDWEHKYPHDSWIPTSLFALERLYAKIDSDAARAKAKAIMLWLVHDYPQNALAKQGKKELDANLVGVKPAATPVPGGLAAPIMQPIVTSNSSTTAEQPAPAASP